MRTLNIFPIQEKDKVSPPSVLRAAGLFADNGSQAFVPIAPGVGNRKAICMRILSLAKMLSGANGFRISDHPLHSR
jgi:hypothetical protein